MKNLSVLMLIATLFVANIFVSFADTKQEIAKANKKGQVIFLVVTEQGNAQNQTAINLAKTAQKSYSKSSVLELDRSNSANSELIKKYRLDGAPVPMVLVISSNGVASGGAPLQNLSAEGLVKMIPSPIEEKVLKACNDGKSVFVVFTKKNDVNNKKQIDVSKSACKTMNNKAVALDVDIDDGKEKSFIAKHNIDKNATFPITIVFDSKGQEASTFNGITDAKSLTNAAQKKKQAPAVPAPVADQKSKGQIMNIYKLVFTELWHRKSQLISALLAITLGIAVIVGIRSVTVVSEKAVAVNLDNLGANILVLPQGASIDNYYSADIDAPTFPEEYVEKIRNSTLAGVDNISPKLTRRIKINNNVVVLTGILPSSEIISKPVWQSAGLSGADLQTSCAPSSNAEKSHGYEDEKLKRKPIETLQQDECIVGSNIAKILNLKQGDKVNIIRADFIVFNVLGETGTVDDDRVFAHLHAVQKLTGIENQISVIEIMGCCNAISDGLLGKLRNILPDTKITTINQIVSTQIKTNQLMNKISIIFLIIILFVGGISIGNSIWANVNERKKEIGTLRMIGFTKGKIYEILLLKAAILGILGGILGYFLGTFAGMYLGPRLAGLNIQAIPIYLLWSILISLAISLLGSLIPAYLAGKIEPYKIMQES